MGFGTSEQQDNNSKQSTGVVSVSFGSQAGRETWGYLRDPGSGQATVSSPEILLYESVKVANFDPQTLDTAYAANKGDPTPCHEASGETQILPDIAFLARHQQRLVHSGGCRFSAHPD
jgi:hypothetical protein